MLLTQILNKVNVIQISGTTPAREVTGIEYDSRKVTDGSVFVAIKGFNTDGHLFIQSALDRKAIAAVAHRR